MVSYQITYKKILMWSIFHENLTPNTIQKGLEFYRHSIRPIILNSTTQYWASKFSKYHRSFSKFSKLKKQNKWVFIIWVIKFSTLKKEGSVWRSNAREPNLGFFSSAVEKKNNNMTTLYNKYFFIIIIIHWPLVDKNYPYPHYSSSRLKKHLT